MVDEPKPAANSTLVANDDLPSDPAVFQAVNERIIQVIEAVLVAHAEHRGSGLEPIDVREVMAALRNVPGLMPKLLHGLIGPEQVVKYVRDPFTRALVQPFSHLFDTAPGQSLEAGALSRRMLPGFFIAIRLMIGGERYEQAQAVCEAALVRRRQSPEDMGTLEFWDDVFADPSVVNVVTDIYARVLLRLTKYEKRKAWFIRMVNSQLSAVEHTQPAQGEASWRFQVSHFRNIMVTVCADSKTGNLSTELADYATSHLGQSSLEQAKEVLACVQREPVEPVSGAITST